MDAALWAIRNESVFQIESYFFQIAHALAGGDRELYEDLLQEVQFFTTLLRFTDENGLFLIWARDQLSSKLLKTKPVLKKMGVEVKPPTADELVQLIEETLTADDIPQGAPAEFNVEFTGVGRLSEIFKEVSELVSNGIWHEKKLTKYFCLHCSRMSQVKALNASPVAVRLVWISWQNIRLTVLPRFCPVNPSVCEKIDRLLREADNTMTDLYGDLIPMPGH